MNVEWKEINPDYIVSSDGRVGSRKRGGLSILKPRPVGEGYFGVSISTGGVKRNRYIHRLVAEAFLGPRPTPKHEVNHKNGVRSDNRDNNLEWVTRSENQRHRFDVLKHGQTRGENHCLAKLTEANVREIRTLVASGDSQKTIAAAYGVSTASVWQIKRGKSWAWLK